MSLRTRLALTFALVVALSLLVAALSLSALLWGYSTRLVAARLDDVAVVVFAQARTLLLRGETPGQLFDFLNEQAAELDVEILLLSRDGRVVREAGREPGLVGLRLPIERAQPVAGGRPRQLLQGTFRLAGRPGTFRYTAVPLAPLVARANEAALLMVAQAERSPFEVLGPLLARLGLAGAAGLLAGLLAAVVLARWLERPLGRLIAGTEAVARGDYGQRVPLEGPPELARLADSFNRMATEVERSRGIVRRFVGTLSHELRTPLTSIRGFAQAFLDGSVSAPDDQRRAMRIVDHEARRMQRLTAELLDLSRLQAGEVPLRCARVELRPLVGQCAEVLGGRAQERGIRIELELAADLAVEGDADRLEQVFTNLLDNAIKFTPRGERVRLNGQSIGVAPRPLPGREGRPFGRRTPPPPPRRFAVVEVANPGPTIPPDELPRIFEPFYTGRAGQERGGTGLGLPIAREIARAHGGDLTAESADGLTTFRVLLPLALPSRDEAVTPEGLTATPAF